jgi:hypothetical protein
VLERRGGTKEAFFGYENPLSFRGLPAGKRNRVTRDGVDLADAHQPAELHGGVVANAFSKVLNGDEELTWSLDRQSVTVNAASALCSGRELARVALVPSTAIFATEDVEIGDYVSVEAPVGLASVVSGGALSLGASSLVGNALARGRLSVKELGAVAGVAVSALEPEVAASAGVAELKRAAFEPHSLDWSVTFSGGRPDQLVHARQSLSLPPGRYGRVVVEDQAELVLPGGEYEFDSLVVSEQATIQIDAGEVVVHVASRLDLAGDTDVATDASLVLGYLGTEPARIVSSLHATVVAPWALLTLGELPNSVYTGAFFANRVVVRPMTQVQFSER